MKRTLLTILILISITIAGFSQKLSGEYSNDGKSTGSYYTKVKWEVSYSFIEKNDLFYIKFYNPKITVPNYSRYHDEFGKEYSLADLNLASWPNGRQLPFAMSVKVNITDGYNNYESTASCNADFTCGETYIVSKTNVKNVTLQNFRVTGVSYFRANLGGEPAVDDILKNKRQSGGKSPATSNVSANDAGLPANTSGNNPLTNYTPGYTKQETTNQLITQAASLAGNLLDEWNAASERKRAKQLATYEENRAIEGREMLKKDRAIFVDKYLPLMDKAEKGDENARMTLYFTSEIFYSKSSVPQREQWFRESIANNNTDALLEAARIARVSGGDVPFIERAISLGSVDAMVYLATNLCWPKMQNEERALQLFNKAAELGSPNAMFTLGMIHKYGRIDDNKHLEKFKIAVNEKTALIWFMKSFQPSYQESIFCKSIPNRYLIASYNFFNSSCVFEIEKIIYKNSKKKKIVAGYEDAAKQYGELSNRYVSLKNDPQKFDPFWQ